MVCPHVCNVTTVVTVRARGVTEPRRRIVVERSSVLFWSAKVCVARPTRFVEFLGAYTKGRRGRVVYVLGVRLFLTRDQTCRRGEGEHSTENFEDIFENRVYIFNWKIIKTDKPKLGPGRTVRLRWSELTEPCYTETKYRFGFVQTVVVSEKAHWILVSRTSRADPKSSLMSAHSVRVKRLNLLFWIHGVVLQYFFTTNQKCVLH